MTLHIVTTSRFQSVALQDCLEIADRESDVLVLMADGVYGLGLAQFANADITVYYLTEDANDRGIVNDGVCLPINYAELVALTEAHQSITTWS